MNKEKLLKAIELAQDPGKCQYFNNGKPSCVIGQLFALEGAKEEELLDFNERSIYNCLRDSDSLNQYLDEYPSDLLEKLQDVWDVPLNDNESIDDRKVDLVELVNSYEE